MATKELKEDDYLVVGYLRRKQKEYDLLVPKSIGHIISLYNCNFDIYGIGKNEYSAFAMSKRQKHFIKINNLSSLITDFDKIFINFNSIIIETAISEIFVCGYNQWSRLGLIKTDKSSIIDKFTEIDDLNLKQKAKIISSGIYNEGHTFIYTIDNNLYSSGNNCLGSFGNGETSNSASLLNKIKNEMTLSFTQNNSIIDIKCGRYHSLFLTSNGTLWSSGYNGSGQCGVVGDKQLLFPQIVKIPDNAKIIKIACGKHHNLAITEYFDVIIFGENEYDQLGIVNNYNHQEIVYKPIYNQFFKDTNIKIKDIECGRSHSLCISLHGNCFVFGDNQFGQIGNGTFDNQIAIPFYVFDDEKMKEKTNVIQGCCGDQHNVLLTGKNDVLCFGDNEYSQCSSIIQTEIICKPHIISKYHELHVSGNACVEKVLALNKETIIIINPNIKFE